MKRGYVLHLLFLALFLLPFASAVNNCNNNPNQLIMRISSTTNAHAQSGTYSGSDIYSVEVCYNEIFGQVYQASGDPRQCTSSNVVAYLSNSTDAHGAGHPAVGPNQPGPFYSVPVCYGNLACRTVSNFFGQSQSCASNEQEIVRLSSTTNAHFAQRGDTSYDVKICCSVSTGSGACGNNVVEAGEECDDGNSNNNDACTNTCRNARCGDGFIQGTETCDDQNTANGDGCSSVCQMEAAGSGFNLVEWTDFASTRINPNNAININRTVYLHTQTGFPAGTQLTFNVKEDDGLADDDIATITSETQADGSANAPLFISDEVFHRGDGGAFLEGPFLQFYYTVQTTDPAVSSQINTSYIILVNRTQGVNTPPVAVISGPIHRGVYFANVLINFSEMSRDSEGSLSYRWSVAEDGFTSTQRTFVHQFQTAGQKTITLRVTDEDGESDEDQISILVIASPGILAYISRPSHQQVVVNDSLRVFISANDSYALVADEATCPSVRCLAGVCPATTQNAPTGCAAQLPIANPQQPFTPLSFDWSFSDGDSGDTFDGAGRVAIVKQFGLPSSSSSDFKRVNLTLSYNNSGEGVSNLIAKTSRSFTLLNARQCLDNGRVWADYNYTTGEVIGTYSTITSSRCSGADLVNGTGDDCCPIGNQCTIQGCVASNRTICADLRTRNECTADRSLRNNPSNPGYNDPPACGTYYNGSIVQCACGWVNQNGQSSCALVKTFTFPGGAPDEVPTCSPATCSYQASSQSECINGYATVDVVAVLTGGGVGSCGGVSESECVSGPRTILCGSPSITLPFFGWQQFILSALLIIAIYFLARRKR